MSENTVQNKMSEIRAFNNMVADLSLQSNSNKDPILHFNEIKNEVIQYISDGLDIYPNIRIYLTTHFQYHTINPTDGQQIDTGTWHIKCHTLNIQRSARNNLDTIYELATDEIKRKFEEWTYKNTKYRFDKIIKTVLSRDIHQPIRGGTWIELPKWIKNKLCCINVKNIKTNKFKCINNEDQRCFEYALESILNPAKDHSDRPSNYNIDKYNELCMTYPVTLSDETIDIYEKFFNISTNVYGVFNYHGEEQLHSMYTGKNFEFPNKKHVNILAIKSVSSQGTFDCDDYVPTIYHCVARLASSDGSMSACGSTGPGFDSRRGSNFNMKIFNLNARRVEIYTF